MASASARPSQNETSVSVEELRKKYLAFVYDKDMELREQRIARHYYHSDQLTPAEVAELRKRKQPPIVANRIQRKIDGIVGFIERMKQDPKAYPRTPQVDQSGEADLSTAVIRYALDAADWNMRRPESCRSAAINGIGGLALSIVKGDQGDPEIGLDPVDVEWFFYDQRSVREDFSDAHFMGLAKWIDLDDAIQMFPDHREEIEALVSTGVRADGGLGLSQQLQDRETRWINSNEKQLFLVEHWYREQGAWRYCYYSYNLELAQGDSPFKDEKGRTISRFLMFSANVDHDGDRYGFVRGLKPLQDEINSRRSKALHIMHTRRIIAEKGAVEDVEVARREAVRPDGYIEKNPGKEFEFDDAASEQAWTAQVELLKESQTELENFGPNPALIGNGIDNSSGRAIQLLQQAGLAELGPFLLAYRNWKLKVYRAIWSAAQSLWTAQRWIRVTDDQNVAQFIKLNGLGIDPQTGQPRMVNALGALDVDIILDEGPDVINLMEDTFDALVKLSQGGVQIPPAVIVELSSIDSTTKKRVLAMIEQAQQPNPMMQQAQQLQLQGLAAKNDETKAKTIKALADAHAAAQPEPVELPSAPQAQPPKPPSIAVNYKDMPPEAQAQALAQDGIYIHPAVLAAHAARMKAADTAAQAALASHKAALMPSPQAAQ
jgi:hypothetical protein